MGEIICKIVLVEPALHPDNVTKLGFPPNALILSRIHFKTTTWSLKPLLPGASFVPVLKKPKICFLKGFIAKKINNFFYEQT